jgi:hypothetical protein
MLFGRVLGLLLSSVLACLRGKHAPGLLLLYWRELKRGTGDVFWLGPASVPAPDLLTVSVAVVDDTVFPVDNAAQTEELI